MHKLLITFFIYMHVQFNTIVADLKQNVLCDSGLNLCVCRQIKYNLESDIVRLYVDCSYHNNDILHTNYSLPSTVHTLDISSNDLTSVVKTNMLQSQTMEKLQLRRNIITEIDKNAFNLPNLIHMDLSENNLEHIDPEIFHNTRKLKYLNIATNKLTTFVSNTFHYLNSLESIILDRNNIGSYVKEFNMFQSDGLGLNSGIKHISIANINLDVLPDDMFADAYDLRQLKISNNNITSVPELPFTLEYLDLSDNPIPEIYMEDFHNFPILKELKLNNLKIKKVPDCVFSAMKALKKLELERNLNLTQFSALAFGQEVLDDADDFALEELSLQSSRLTVLSEDLEIALDRLHRLNLQGNRWKCDCKIKWLRDLQMNAQDVEHLRCYTPMPLYDKKLFEVDKKYFTCDTDRAGALLVVAVTTFCLVLMTIAVWFFVFIPRYQSRGDQIQRVVYPTAPYTLLPLNPNSAEMYYN